MSEKRGCRLRSNDVAQILGCSPDDVVELARRGKLKAIKVGKFWKFHSLSVEAYKRKTEKGD